MSSSVFLPPDQTRLVTICAHVDHGKTTLADNLIEANGIISERLAGTLRYLDSTEEEQRRGITMRASAIGLRHRYKGKRVGVNNSNNTKGGDKDDGQDIIVHLLDSPGHSDFSPEVSSSLQCCDGCLLVVDAVEGMCARTHQVIREAHSHQLVPVLVINKIDRLCTDLCLSPTESYLRLRTLLESVNAACAAMIVSMRAEEVDDDEYNDMNDSKGSAGQNINEKEAKETEEESQWTFDAAKGNVIFASALFGWGFTVPALARSLFRSKILPIKPVVLKQYLFGDFRFKSGEGDTDGKMLKWKPEHADEDTLPLFAEYGIKPIWTIYEGIAMAAVASGLGSSLFADGRTGASTSFNNGKKAKIEASTLGMPDVLLATQEGYTTTTTQIDTVEKLQDVLTRTGSASSEDAVLRAVLRRYRPLSDIVLDVVYEVCPSPRLAAAKVRSRALALVDPSPTEVRIEQGALRRFVRIKEAVRSCSVSVDAPAVAHVCKFMVADRSQIRDPSYTKENDDETPNVILGLARVLSGSLKTNSTYHVMGPKHTFETSAPSRAVRLYLLMGSSFVLVPEVPAGHLCAVQNLEDLQIKTATLCDSDDGMPLRGFADHGIRPLVKVNVESVDPMDTAILERGLLKLSLADAAVEVTATAKGERILACLGELHLEQSILDLKNIYCEKEDIQLRISEPIVEFGEATAWFRNDICDSTSVDRNKIEELDFATFISQSSKVPPLRQMTIPPYNEEEGIEFAHRGRTRSIVSGRVGAISLRVVPLERVIYEALIHGAKPTDGFEASMEDLKMALGFPKDCDTNSAMKSLLQSVISLDDFGNAIVSTVALETGRTVAAVLSDKNEVYVPRKRERGKAVSSVISEKGDGPAETSGWDEYRVVQSQIQSNGFLSVQTLGTNLRPSQATVLSIWKNQLRGSLVAGFQMAMRAGPICEEPIRGVLVVLEGLELALTQLDNPKQEETPEDTTTIGMKAAKPLSGGMVAATLRVGIRSALLSRPARLVESHLKLTLHSSLAGLGPLYSILSRRRGKVLDDSMVDGTDLLQITAMLPHAESFGLAPELFRESSGEVTAPELVFSHWERLDQEHDPFWIPTSLEEREDFGELLTSGDVSTGLNNTPLNYIRKVRQRKGLLANSNRTVVAAEKQRTIKK